MSVAEQILRLEEKVAFMEQALQQLSDEHVAQQRELIELKEQITLIIKKLNNQSDTSNLESDFSSHENERPPHY